VAEIGISDTNTSNPRDGKQCTDDQTEMSPEPKPEHPDWRDPTSPWWNIPSD